VSREHRISPEPRAEERDAILAAVHATLRREDDLARPAPWRVGGWVQRRVGISDLGPSLNPDRRWALSTRLGWGGREFPGLNGRGDAK
jgi:hypothetical protein